MIPLTYSHISPLALHHATPSRNHSSHSTLATRASQSQPQSAVPQATSNPRSLTSLPSQWRTSRLARTSLLGRCGRCHRRAVWRWRSRCWEGRRTSCLLGSLRCWPCIGILCDECTKGCGYIAHVEYIDTSGFIFCQSTRCPIWLHYIHKPFAQKFFSYLWAKLSALHVYLIIFFKLVTVVIKTIKQIYLHSYRFANHLPLRSRSRNWCSWWIEGIRRGTLFFWNKTIIMWFNLCEKIYF